MKYLKPILLFIPRIFWKLMRFCGNKAKAFYSEHGLRGLFSRKNKVLVTVVVLGAAGVVFYGGMKYQVRHNSPSKPEVLGIKSAGEAPTVPLVTSHERIEGTVIKIDEKNIKLKSSDGKSEDYTIGPEIEVMSLGKFIKPGDIKTGDKVRIYLKTGSDKSQAVEKINLLDKVE